MGYSSVANLLLLVRLLVLCMGSTIAALWIAASLGLSVRLFLLVLGG